jgi:succinyl-diaminopimelate desuccinylase
MKEEILKKIASYEDYAVELQRGLTAIPALSPSSGGEGEYDKAKYLEGELKKLKFDSIEWINAPQKEAKNGIRPNLVARYKGKDSSRTVWFMGHMDVVPPGDLKLWKTDPWKLEVKGRMLYGRGVEDNQQAIVSSLLVARAMMELNYRPDYDLALLFCADEETGSGYGADYIAANRPEIFGKNDVFFVPDSGVEDGSLIEVAEKSILWLQVTTKGVQCHGSRPNAGKNTFKAAADLITRYQSLYDTFPAKDDLYEPPYSTFEPTKKEANVPNINTIPGEDIFYMDCRVMPQYRLDDVKAEMRRIADEVEKKYGVTISFKPHQEVQAAPPTDPEAPIVKCLKAAITEVLGVKEPRAYGIGGGTVAAFFRQMGLSSVVYSQLNGTEHMPNESTKIDYIINDAKVFAITTITLASAGK